MGSRFLWVGNLRGDLSPHVLGTAMSRYGYVEELRVHPAPIGSDCWAVVTFRHPAEAQAARAGMHGSEDRSLTFRFLKLRPWVEHREGGRSPHAWRPPHQQQHPFGHPQQQQQRPAAVAAPSASWADAEDEEEGEYCEPQQAASGGHWGGGGGREQGGQAWAGVQAAAEDEQEEDEDEEDDDFDPIVELWVGNLCQAATRLGIRRAFECFGAVSSVHLQAAPGGRGLQFAFVQLPASAAEAALEDLDGLVVFELSGDMPLKVKQSTRSVVQLMKIEQRQQHTKGGYGQPYGLAGQQQQWQQAKGSSQPGPAAAVNQPLEVVCEDGSVGRLVGEVRAVKKRLLADGPPSRGLWVGNVGGHASKATVHAVFGRFGTVRAASLHQAPGFQNDYKFVFVEMGCAAEAQAAKAALQGDVASAICDTRPLKLRYAWPQHLARPAGSIKAVRPAAPGSFGHANGADFGASAVSAGPGSAAAGAQAARPAAAGAAGSAPAKAAAPSPSSCCAGCGAPADVVSLKRCSLCRAVYYCGQPCQVADWEARHATECGQLRQLSTDLQQAAWEAEGLELLLAAVRQPAGRHGSMLRAVLEQAAQAAK